MRRVPVELEVFDFELPDQSSLTAMVYFEPEQVSSYQGHALTDRYHRFAHRHRIELVTNTGSSRPGPGLLLMLLAIVLIRAYCEELGSSGM